MSKVSPHQVEGLQRWDEARWDDPQLGALYIGDPSSYLPFIPPFEAPEQDFGCWFGGGGLR